MDRCARCGTGWIQETDDERRCIECGWRDYSFKPNNAREIFFGTVRSRAGSRGVSESEAHVWEGSVRVGKVQGKIKIVYWIKSPEDQAVAWDLHGWPPKIPYSLAYYVKREREISRQFQDDTGYQLTGLADARRVAENEEVHR